MSSRLDIFCIQPAREMDRAALLLSSMLAKMNSIVIHNFMLRTRAA